LTHRNLFIAGGPQGLLLRFSNDERLVAIQVLSQASASIRTASEIHVGSTRDDVMAAYGPDLTAHREDLVFTPAGAQFQGKVITFLMNDQGTVESFIAGESNFASQPVLFQRGAQPRVAAVDLVSRDPGGPGGRVEESGDHASGQLRLGRELRLRIVTEAGGPAAGSEVQECGT